MSAGKGSKPRPKSISCDEYGDNYDAIFRKKKSTKPMKNGSVGIRRAILDLDKHTPPPTLIPIV